MPDVHTIIRILANIQLCNKLGFTSLITYRVLIMVYIETNDGNIAAKTIRQTQLNDHITHTQGSPHKLTELLYIIVY